jgi:hypothetical protein
MVYRICVCISVLNKTRHLEMFIMKRAGRELQGMLTDEPKFHVLTLSLRERKISTCCSRADMRVERSR